MQHFDGEYRTKTFACGYEIDGIITGFEMHPSGDYLVITSDQGFYYVFRIDTGELRGKVPVVTQPAGLSIDPSGLYLAISAKSTATNPDTGMRKRWTLSADQAQL